MASDIRDVLGSGVRLAVAVAPALLAACSVATASVDPLTTGSLGAVTAEAEVRSQCGRLEAQIGDQLVLAKSLPGQAKAQRATAPPSLFAALARLAGDPSSDVPAKVEFERVRSRVTALAAQSTRLGCRPFDITTPLGDVERALQAEARTGG